MSVFHIRLECEACYGRGKVSYTSRLDRESSAICPECDGEGQSRICETMFEDADEVKEQYGSKVLSLEEIDEDSDNHYCRW